MPCEGLQQTEAFFFSPSTSSMCIYVQVFLTMHTQQRPEVKVSECISQHGHGSWRAIMDRRDRTRLQDLGEQVFSAEPPPCPSRLL